MYVYNVQYVEDDESATTITVVVVVAVVVAVILMIIVIGIAIPFMVQRNRGQGKHNVESIDHIGTDSKRPAPGGCMHLCIVKVHVL